MKNKLVYISGIGADKRAFTNLHIKSDASKIHVEWLSLESSNESFESYCNRIVKAYDITEDDTLIGLSFGGLIAQHIAKELGNQKVVLISSFRNKKDLQPLMSLGLRLKLYKALPSFRIPLLSDVIAIFLNSWNSESRIVLKEMLKSADFSFINWSIKQIDRIDLYESFSEEYLCFTGTNDKLVKNWGSPNQISIESGSHFMLFDLAEEISKHINQFNKNETQHGL